MTGASGHICYSLLFRLAAGELYGNAQRIELRLLGLPQAQASLRGVVMELEDCAFPLPANILMTDDPAIAFKDTDAAFLVGSGKSMNIASHCPLSERRRQSSNLMQSDDAKLHLSNLPGAVAPGYPINIQGANCS